MIIKKDKHVENEHAEDKQFNYGKKFIQDIRTRLFKRNQNWLGLVCGGTGSGKSYSALSLADAIMAGRMKAEYVCFNVKEILSLLNDKTRIKKGTIYIFDEAGVGMSSREWYSIQNRVLGRILQTFRNLNCGMIFTTPNKNFLDKQARALFHNYFETERIDRWRKRAYLKSYAILHMSKWGKDYEVRPGLMIGNKSYRRVRYVGLRYPREELVRKYERMKSSYTEELNRDSAEAVGDNVSKPEDRLKTSAVKRYEKIAKEVFDNLDKYTKKTTYGRCSSRVDVGKICTDFHVGMTVGYRIRHIVDSKVEQKKK